MPFCMFQCGGCQVFYIVYRAVCVVWWLGVFIYDVIDEPKRHLFLTFLTNWSYMAVGISALFQLASAVHGAVYEDSMRSSSKTPILYQLSWFFYSLISSGTIVVSLLYWGVIYEGEYDAQYRYVM